MRGHDPSTFLYDWRNPCDGLPLDLPPYAVETEIFEFPDNGEHVISAGLITMNTASSAGLAVITERDADGVIIHQSDPSQIATYYGDETWNLPLYLELGDDVVWLLHKRLGASTPMQVKVFDRVTFDQLGEFNLANSTPYETYSFRAIENDIVFIGLISGIARKYDTSGNLLDTLVVADVDAVVSKPVRFVNQYVSRHTRRDYNNILINVQHTDLTRSWCEFALTDFSLVNQGPYKTAANSESSPTRNPHMDFFMPSTDAAIVAFRPVSGPHSGKSVVSRIDLGTLDYDYLVQHSEAGGVYTHRVTEDYAFLRQLSGTAFIHMINVGDGSLLWWRGTGSPTGGAICGAGCCFIDLGIMSSNGISTSVYDADDGTEHYSHIIPTLYGRQAYDVAFASNIKTGVSLP